MNTAVMKRVDTKPPVVREYDIGGIRFIVKATVKDGATEDAVTIVRRLIRKEIYGNNGHSNGENNILADKRRYM